MDVFVSKVTSRGQITLPSELRRRDCIGEDDYVAMRKVGKFIVVAKLADRLDEITSEFEKEARANKIGRGDLEALVEKVRARH